MKNLKIEKLFVFSMVDPNDGTEGVCGCRMPNGEWMALVGADLSNVESLRPIAQAMATRLGREVKLLLFSEREDMEIIKP